MKFLEQEEAIALQIELAPGIERLRVLDENVGRLSGETVRSVLAAAARFAEDRLAPLNSEVDRIACRLADGRVVTPEACHRMMRAFVSEGWPGLGAKAEWGGQELPLVLQVGCQEIFDRGCVAFGMLPGLLRSASRLLEAHASDVLKAEWLPKLAIGAWCATICISEPDAGSDLGRLRARATQREDGSWSVSGEKVWISFGDHDLAERIGHCTLARTDPGSIGTTGLSLFLVPDCFFDACGSVRRNSIVVRRLEDKLGLHGSPTCALGFEDAQAFLVGQEGRGLQALFAMIGSLRLSVAVQSLGIASGALSVAMTYAAERRQGGSPAEPPVAIARHADVQRVLLGMAARVEVIRGLALALAVAIELSEKDGDPQQRESYAHLAAWLQPVVKTLGAEAAFDVSHEAIQVLGGSGYTREWPLEQGLRDARVFAIYEGTSGMQALDLLHRRLWRDRGRGLKIFLRLARADVDAARSKASEVAEALTVVLDLLEKCATQLMVWSDTPRAAEAGASALLQLAGEAATSWIALRLLQTDGQGTAVTKLRAAARFWLSAASSRAKYAADEALLGGERLVDFADVAQAFE